ncbi:protein ECT2 [Anabrus simplex]|uniref:protein ECT2 n=1 Tax=Anabrus simplex TaxID=316456 RepID=UPI0035A37BE9
MDEQNVCFADSQTTDVSDTNSVDSAKVECPPATQTRICLVGDLGKDPKISQAAQSFGVPVVISETGREFLNDGTCDTVFVVKNFSGPVFNAIHQSEMRILGPTALQECAQKGEGLPSNTRPLYSLAMSGLVICFTGFRKKDELNRLILLIHHMGGSIRKDMASKVTHLIANSCGGEKYRYAMTFCVPIMSEAWVDACWEKRDCPGVSAVSEEMMEQKLKPFHGAHVCFYGFSDEERLHMTEVLQENGGTPVELEDPRCSHVVVDESEVQSIPEKAPLRAPIVKAEWFWASVQNEGCADEKEYLFEDYLEALLSPSNRLPSQHSTPASRARKRKRLRDAVSRLVQIDSPAIHKRRSSVSDAALLSMSGSFLDDDHTLSPEKPAEGEGESSSETPRKSASPRRQVFLELVQTEANYVGILHTIMTLFKVPLEEMAETNSPLLNNTELKIIFGNLPPIYEVHCHMLEELKWMATHWKEDCSIGKIILKYAPDLMKAYPPFVNFFENTREMLVNCDQSKPRFHAFLKIGQTRSECGRQTLQELLIRPVQRLPSISLLLNDILKHTPKSNSDQTALEQALAAIREVMTHINEDKRKTEGQLVMFDIFNDIDNCPPHLVSSHRNFIVRCDVMELSDGLSGRGDSLVLFLFSDILEVCKKRSKVFNSLKSPNTTTGSLHSVKMSNGKPFKHIRLMPLSSIRHVFDIHETDDCHNVFALRCRSNQELKEKLYLFTLADEETDKLGFLRTLCRQMANTMCKTDAENFLTSVDSQSLDIDTSDINSGTLSKAFKFASRTRIKVGRAFSFNKTPSKLKRAVSTMMSPFGSTTNLTPASQLAQMRLASCNNLSELSSSPLKGESSYIAPMSVQPTRKNKSASLNVMSLRRL